MIWTYRRRRRRRELSLLTLLPFCLTAMPSVASYVEEDSGREGAIALAVAGAVTLASTALAAAVVNGVYAGKGRRSPVGWRITGWISTGLNLAMGSLILGVSAFNDRDDDDGVLAWGAGHLTVGFLSAGMTLWASVLPEDKPRKTFAMVPWIAPASGGSSIYGAGFQLAGW